MMPSKIFGIFILIILFLVAVDSYSQVSPEEILNLIQNTREQEQDSLYYELYAIYKYSNPNKAREYAEKVFDLSKKYNRRLFYVKSLHAKGYFERTESDYVQALKYYDEGLQIATEINYEVGILMMYNNLGQVCYYQQEYDKAIDFYLKEINLAVKYKEPYDEAIAYNNIAGIYTNLGNYSEALNYYLQCIQTKKENNLFNGLDLNYCNAGICYNELGDYQKAIETFLYVKDKYPNSDINIYAFYNYGLAQAYRLLKNYDEAKNYYNISLNASKSSNDVMKQITNFMGISKIFLEQNNLNKAENYLDSAMVLSIMTESKLNLSNIYRDYSIIAQKKGDYRKALSYSELMVQLKDSIFNTDVTNNIKNSFLAFQQSQNDVVIQKKESLILRNRQFAYIITIIALLLIIVLAFSYRTLTYRRQLSERLNELVKIKTREISDTNIQLVRSRKELDTFLYRTSHDIRGPIATLMGLTNLALLESRDATTSSYLKRIDSTADKLNEIISRLTNVSQINSMPLDISSVNLYTAVNEIIEEIRGHSGSDIKIQFRLTGNFPEQVNTDKILLKIILNNILENGFKYFDPGETEPVVELKIEVNGRLDLAVSDNGMGINPEYKDKIFELFFVASERRGAGLGLYQAQLATQKLGGTILLSSFQKPTCFEVHLPLMA